MQLSSFYDLTPLSQRWASDTPHLCRYASPIDVMAYNRLHKHHVFDLVTC
jgi:hypothetical protein